MSDESEQHYNTTEQAYSAGVNKGKELQKQADAEDKGGHGKDELTFDQLQHMSREELTERKDEVDKALEKQGRER